MSARVPRWVLVVLGIAAVAGTAMMFAGGWFGGVTWDEKTHVLMLQTFLEQGWNVTPDALLNGSPDPAYIWGVYVYGPVGELVGHLVNTITGLEPWGTLSYDSAAYVGRHIAIGLMALAGTAAAATSIWLILRSWAWALVGAAIVATTPLWVGHGMFNIKDIPVAAGYTIATLGIVALCHADYRFRPVIRVQALASLVIGTVLASGTREAMGVPVAAGVVLALILLWFAQWRTSDATFGVATRDSLRRLVEGVGAMVVSYLLLVLIYPKAFINPVVLAWQALVVSARFPFDEAVLTSGTWMDQPPPWTYLPHWFLAQLPVLIIVGAGLFVACWLVVAVRTVIGRPSWLDAHQWAMTGAVLVQMTMMPALAIALRSNMYNGSRQFLFVVPAAAILATVAIWSVLTWARSSARARLWSGIVWAIVAIGVLVPLIGQSTLFPYNYVFMNAPTAAQSLEGRWPTDYWRFSSKELMARLPATGPESCGYEQGRSGEQHPCSIEPMFKPFLSLRGSEAKPGELGPGQYWFVRENQGTTDLPAGCTMHDEITRRLFGQQVIIGQIAVCDGAAS